MLPQYCWCKKFLDFVFSCFYFNLTFCFSRVWIFAFSEGNENVGLEKPNKTDSNNDCYHENFCQNYEFQQQVCQDQTKATVSKLFEGHRNIMGFYAKITCETVEHVSKKS